MNQPSPLVPQGSMMEQKNKVRARVKIAVFFVLAVHGIGLLALLMQGCHKEEPQPPQANATTITNLSPALEAPGTVVTEPTNSQSAYATAPVPGGAGTTPATPAEPAPPAPGTAAEYVVASGDSFSSIASHYRIPTKALMAANPGIEPTKLKPGQKLQIPAVTPAATPTATLAAVPTTNANGDTMYIVKSGDNLTTIASHFGTSIKAIRTANNLKTDSIKVGQKLAIPAKSTAGGAPASPAPADGNGAAVAAGATGVAGAGTPVPAAR